MPVISVIIPVYNVEKTLTRCVDSVLNQTYKNFEIILVDDGSSDSSGTICDRYDEGHENIYVIHKANGGLSDARNAGLRSARGEFVMFLDSDDWLAPECLETLSQHLDADWVISGIYTQAGDGRIYPQKIVESKYVSRENYAAEIPILLQYNYINYVHSKIYRHSIITDHQISFEDDSLTSAEDTVFNFTYLPYCKDIYVCQEFLHYYTYSPNGLGRKFFPERFERSKRLHLFLIDACTRLGILNAQMERVLANRYLKFVNSCIYKIANMDSSYDYKKKKERLDDLYHDTVIREARKCISDIPLKNLDLLFSIGSRRFLAIYRKKQLRYLIGCYYREILRRLHIANRK